MWPSKPRARVVGHPLFERADIRQRPADVRLDDDRQRQIGQFEPLAHTVHAAVAPADEAVHRLAQPQHPAAADLLGVELVAVADPVAAAVGALVHRVTHDAHAADSLVSVR